MSEKDLSIEDFQICWYEAWNAQLTWEYDHACCFVCRRSRADLDAVKPGGYSGQVSRTNDRQNYVCSDHMDLDTSKDELDVADYIKFLQRSANIFHRPGPSDEHCCKHIDTYFASNPKRYCLINIPAHLKHLIRHNKSTQPTLF